MDLLRLQSLQGMSQCADLDTLNLRVLMWLLRRCDTRPGWRDARAVAD